MLSLPSLSQNTTSAVLSTEIAIITNPTRQVNPFTSEHSPSGDLGLPVSDVQDQNLDSVDSVVWFHDSGTYIVQVSSVFIYVGMYCDLQIDFQVLLHKSALFVSREQYCNGCPAVTIFANFVKNNKIMISLFCFSWGLDFMTKFSCSTRSSYPSIISISEVFWLGQKTLQKLRELDPQLLFLSEAPHLVLTVHNVFYFFSLQLL